MWALRLLADSKTTTSDGSGTVGPNTLRLRCRAKGAISCEATRVALSGRGGEIGRRTRLRIWRRKA